MPGRYYVLCRRRSCSEQLTTSLIWLVRRRSWSPRTRVLCTCYQQKPEIVDRKWRHRCLAPPSDDDSNHCRRARCRRTMAPPTRPLPVRGAADRRRNEEKRTGSWRTGSKTYEFRHFRLPVRRYRSLHKPPFQNRRFVVCFILYIIEDLSGCPEYTLSRVYTRTHVAGYKLKSCTHLSPSTCVLCRQENCRQFVAGYEGIQVDRDINE